MKFFIILYSVLFLAACNTSPGNKPKYSPQTSATDSIINSSGAAANTGFSEGARLITINDCFTCHSIDQTLNGPSYKDVSRKYHFNEGNVENLAHGVIRGSKGIWGEKVMTPHPNLSLGDAKLMVRFILSLDSSKADAP